jgi:metal-responsive CopG/Arc/MetJ family transcriptional regulator
MNWMSTGERSMRTTSKLKRKWRTIQLPGDLLEQVDKMVSTPGLGYTSRTEYIKEAVRLRILEIEKQREKS